MNKQLLAIRHISKATRVLSGMQQIAFNDFTDQLAVLNNVHLPLKGQGDVLLIMLEPYSEHYRVVACPFTLTR